MSVLLLSASATAMSMPDAGQNKCYDNTQEIACPQPGVLMLLLGE
ncbi:hypothetical protein [Desulfonatronum sp. SC1]|nr:hypothetical protein [Desulfonatronum sp. SC1]